MSALEDAAREEPLACSTPLYSKMHRKASASGQWTVLSLLRRASREAVAARRLWERATACGDPEMRQQLKQEAVDRSVQVPMTLSLIDVVFPGAVSPQFREDLQALAPEYTVDQPLPDQDESSQPVSPAEVALLNLDGLRKTLLNDLQRTAMVQDWLLDDRPRAAAILDAFELDHRHQVSWTARWLERAVDASKLDDLPGLMVRCFRSFNRATMEEEIDISYHQRFGNYP